MPIRRAISTRRRARRTREAVIVRRAVATFQGGSVGTSGTRLRVGLIGAGLVGQAAHAYFLWDERERFDLVALADPSAAVRAAVGDRYGIPERHASLDGPARPRARRDRRRRCPMRSTPTSPAGARGRPARAVREAPGALARGVRPHRGRPRRLRPRAAGRHDEALSTRPTCACSSSCPSAPPTCATSRSRCATPTRGRSSRTCR